MGMFAYMAYIIYNYMYIYIYFMINISCTVHIYIQHTCIYTLFNSLPYLQKKTILILGVLVVMAGSFWLGSIEKKILPNKNQQTKKKDFPSKLSTGGCGWPIKNGLW